MIIFAEQPKPNSYKLLLLLMVIDTAMASCTHKDNSSCATCVDDFNLLALGNDHQAIQ